METGVGCRVDHQACHLPLLDNGVGIGRFTAFFGNRQGLTGQGGLVNGEIIAADKLHISRHHVADTEFEDIAGHKLPGGYSAPGPVAQDQRLLGQFALQGLEGVERTVLLKKIEQAIDQQHNGDNDEIFPFPNHGGQNCRSFNHPGNRPPESTKNTVPEWLLSLGNLVIAIFCQPHGSFLSAQAAVAICLEVSQALLDILAGECIGGLHRHLST